MRFGIGAVALLAACGPPEGPGEALTAWPLSAPDRDATPVSLPADLDLPRTVPEVRLETRVPLDDHQRGEPLTLWVAGWRTHLGLEVAGHALTCIDEPPVDGYRHHGLHHWRIPASLTTGPELELGLVADNAWEG